MLRSHEPPPYEIVRPSARGRVVLICDHASHRVPEALGTLGISGDELLTHIGWDIGAADVARRLSELLDATLILAGYSRLVIDENRPPHVPSATPIVSGGIRIPGNEGLDDAARAARVETFHRPYHTAIAGLLDDRAREGRDVVLISIHSFTPEPLHGTPRPWPISMLYGSDTRLAHPLLAALRADDPSMPVGDNEPYRVSEETDYAVPVHGVRRGILHTAFELRQDGVATLSGAHAWAERIARLYRSIEPTL
ncbi:MAG: N-formylglutamate amidohydrolase [Deltaproteobacteria bacterium]|nr:N-formylglutamate amidohydrolase [Deltaproteobacteria bacterium]